MDQCNTEDFSDGLELVRSPSDYNGSKRTMIMMTKDRQQKFV